MNLAFSVLIVNPESLQSRLTPLTGFEDLHSQCLFSRSSFPGFLEIQTANTVQDNDAYNKVG